MSSITERSTRVVATLKNLELLIRVSCFKFGLVIRFRIMESGAKNNIRRVSVEPSFQKTIC